MKTSDSELIYQYRLDPVRFVREVFGVDPDLWQQVGLRAFASQDPDKMRIAFKSCTGPGKSALLAWILWNFMSCYASKFEHPKGAAVSMTETNLKENLWAEANKWLQRSEWLKQHFMWTQTLIYNKQHQATWFFSARSFSKSANKEEQGRSLSGLHAKYVLFLIDEAGGVPEQLLKVAEQAMSAEVFCKIVIAGNPTTPSPDIALYAADKDPRYFKVRITADPEDPYRTPRVSKEHAQAQIDRYGKDDPWVMSTIFGEFPLSAITTLLTDLDIDVAQSRVIRPVEVEMYQKALGVDVARFGDDSSIIFPRQGMKTFKYVEMRKADGPTLANRVIGSMVKWKHVDFINVDGTGGFGSSCIDFLKAAHYQPHEIHFSEQAQDPKSFYNRRAEMYWRAAQFIKKSGSLIIDDRLRKEMANIQYSFKGNRIILESKEQIKARLGFSPDVADAFALTFAFDLGLKQTIQENLPVPENQGMVKTYDPWKF